MLTSLPNCRAVSVVFTRLNMQEATNRKRQVRAKIKQNKKKQVDYN